MPTERLEQLLNDININYTQYSHPPLFTCEDADRFFVKRAGLRLKNLFLRDNYGRRHFLLLTRHDKSVDLKQLSKNLGISRIGFASTERLEKYLKVKSGCVSLLALMNDSDNAVEFWIDEEIWQQHDSFLAHPLVNTETLVLSKAEIQRFVEHTGHSITPVFVPGLV